MIVGWVSNMGCVEYMTFGNIRRSLQSAVMFTLTFSSLFSLTRSGFKPAGPYRNGKRNVRDGQIAATG
jgi:hypothetical protein